MIRFLPCINAITRGNTLYRSASNGSMHNWDGTHGYGVHHGYGVQHECAKYFWCCTIGMRM